MLEEEMKRIGKAAKDKHTKIEMEIKIKMGSCVVAVAVVVGNGFIGKRMLQRERRAVWR